MLLGESQEPFRFSVPLKEAESRHHPRPGMKSINTVEGEEEKSSTNYYSF